jgi:flagellar hook-associated protein 3 FlgL
MRIATSELYSSSVSTMENQETQLLSLEQEISSGNALTTPASNPVAAAQAVQLSATSATLTQYSTNQSTALTSLQTEGTALTGVTSTLQSVESAIQEALSGGVNDTNRSAIAQQLEGYRNELLSYANTTDGAGNTVFSGFANVSQVFSNNPGGGVTYNGDAGQRVVQVTNTRDVPVSDNGAAVFMSVQSLGSQSVPLGNSANTGTGVIGAATVTNPSAATNNDTYSISFTAGPADPTNTGGGTMGAVSVTDTTATTNSDNYTIAFVADPTTPTQLDYTVTDNSVSPPTTTQPTAYTSGAPIALGAGLSTSISDTGTPPAVGDSFTASLAGGSMYYTVTDTSNPAVLPVTSAYTSGAAITLGSGLSTSITGSPASGDSFSVTPATASTNTDMFASLDSIIAALQNPAQDNATASATMTNALSTGLAQIGNSLSNVTTIQASVGGREQELQALQTATTSSSLQVTTTLTNITGTDIVQASSQFTAVENALTASQKAFTATQGLSLFQYFNP